MVLLFLLVCFDAIALRKYVMYFARTLDAGNTLQKAIARLVEISVFVRVVYTERSAIIALEELLKVTGHLPHSTDAS